MLDQDTWVSLRLLHFQQGKSKSWLAKTFGISRNTVAKYLIDGASPSYRRGKARGKPVMDEWEECVRNILAEDRNAPRKQKHTARRIFQRLVDEHGYTGSERTVRGLVATLRNQPLVRATLPLEFDPGMDAQVDFGESYAVIDGVRTKLYGFEMRMNYSRKKFLMFVVAANTESFLEAHAKAFEFFGGVPHRLTYDNLSLAVIKVGRGKERVLTRKFKEAMGFYAFDANFCKPGLEGAHEKGGIESSIGFSRRNWLVPVPKVTCLAELNAMMLNRCIKDGSRTVAGQTDSIDDAFLREREMLLSLPTVTFDAGMPRTSAIPDTYQTIGFETNRYSVPALALGKPLRVRSYAERVVISNGLDIVAEHGREYRKNRYVLNIEHYLEQLERKPHSVAHAKPVRDARLPDLYWKFHETAMERSGASQGGKDFIRLLRLHCRYGQEIVHAALQEIDDLSVANADLVRQIICRGREKESEFETLDLSTFPNLENYSVELAATSQYQILLGEDDGEQQVA